MFFCCSHISRHAQYGHPCAPQYNPIHQAAGNTEMYSASVNLALANSVMSLSDSIVHTQFHQPHVLVPANPYLHEGILLNLYIVYDFYGWILCYCRDSNLVACVLQGQSYVGPPSEMGLVSLA